MSFYYWDAEAENRKFLDLARKYVNITHERVKRVSYTGYSRLNFDTMTQSQLEWYLYWRMRLRQGKYLKTDKQYLYLYCCEIINLIGFQNEREAFNHLISVWKHYRHHFDPWADYRASYWEGRAYTSNELDRFLIDWIADFIVVHQIPVNVLEWYRQVMDEGAVVADLDVAVAACNYMENPYENFPEDILYALANYRPDFNKFYQEYNQDGKVIWAYRRAMQAIDEFLRNRSKKEMGLFEQYRSKKPKEIKREPFRGGLHSFGNKPIPITKIYSVSRLKKLPIIIKEIIRYSENVMREQENFRTKLRNIDLPDDWKSAINQALYIPPPRREVVLDMGTVAELQEKSYEIRERLIVEEDEAESSKLKNDSEVQPAGYQQNSIPVVDESWFAHLPDEWQEFTRALQLSQWQFLRYLRDSTGDNDALLLVNQLFDEINELGLNTIGDILLIHAERDTIEFEPEYEATLAEIINIVEREGDMF